MGKKPSERSLFSRVFVMWHGPECRIATINQLFPSGYYEVTCTNTGWRRSFDTKADAITVARLLAKGMPVD